MSVDSATVNAVAAAVIAVAAAVNNVCPSRVGTFAATYPYISVSSIS